MVRKVKLIYQAEKLENIRQQSFQFNMGVLQMLLQTGYKDKLLIVQISQSMHRSTLSCTKFSLILLYHNRRFAINTTSYGHGIKEWSSLLTARTANRGYLSCRWTLILLLVDTSSCTPLPHQFFLVLIGYKIRLR